MNYWEHRSNIKIENTNELDSIKTKEIFIYIVLRRFSKIRYCLNLLTLFVS